MLLYSLVWKMFRAHAHSRGCSDVSQVSRGLAYFVSPPCLRLQSSGGQCIRIHIHTHMHTCIIHPYLESFFLTHVRIPLTSLTGAGLIVSPPPLLCNNAYPQCIHVHAFIHVHQDIPRRALDEDCHSRRCFPTRKIFLFEGAGIPPPSPLLALKRHDFDN